MPSPCSWSTPASSFRGWVLVSGFLVFVVGFRVRSLGSRVWVSGSGFRVWVSSSDFRMSPCSWATPASGLDYQIPLLLWVWSVNPQYFFGFGLSNLNLSLCLDCQAPIRLWVWTVKSQSLFRFGLSNPIPSLCVDCAAPIRLCVWIVNPQSFFGFGL